MKITAARFLLLCLAAACWDAETAAHADAPIKKHIIDDCPAALTELPQLAPKDRQELVPYLQQVLSLKLSQIQGYTPPARLPNQPGPNDAQLREPFGTDVWKSFDPAREVQAKKCAVQSLQTLDALAFVAIPDLLALSRDPMIPQDLKQESDAAIRHIAVQSANDAAFEPPQDTLGRVAELLDKDQKVQAQSIFVELGSKALPYLVEMLKKPDRRTREVAAQTLMHLDPSGTIIEPPLIILLASGDDQLRLRAAAILGEQEALGKEAVEALATLLDDVSADVQQQAAKDLEQFFASSQAASTKLSDDAQARILRAFERGSAGRRATLARALSLLSAGSPAFQDSMIGLVKSEDEDLRSRIIAILGEQETSRESVMQTLLHAVDDRSPTVSAAAIQSLGNQPKSMSRVLPVFVKAFKTLPGSKNDQDSRERFVLQSAESIAKLKPGKAGAPLIPPLVEALGWKAHPGTLPSGVSPNQTESLEAEQADETAAVRALAGIGSSATSALLKATENKDALIQRRALSALGMIAPLEKRTWQRALVLLKDTDPQVRDAASSVLVAGGQESLPALEKLMNSESLGTRLAAAATVAALRPSDPQALKNIAALAPSEPCARVPQLAKLVQVGSGEAKAAVQNRLVACLQERTSNRDAVLQALLLLSPLEDVERTKLAAALQSGLNDKTLWLSLVENAKKLGLKDEETSAILAEALHSTESSVKLRATALLGELGPGARSASPALLGLVHDDAAEILLRHEAAAALARIGEPSFDYVKYFTAELDSDRWQWAQRAIHHLGPALGVPLLRAAYQALPEAKHPVVIQCLGNFGTSSREFLPQLEQFFHEGDPAMRFASAMAIVKVAPEAPSAIEALRLALTTESVKRISSEELGSSALPLLDAIIAAPQNRTEWAGAIELRRTIAKKEH